GSTDNSSKVISKWKCIDNRISSYNQANQGVSSARNKGIEMSKGEYLYFIDADDYIAHDSIEKLVNGSNCYKGNVELVCGNYVRIIENEHINKTKFKFSKISGENLSDYEIISQM